MLEVEPKFYCQRLAYYIPQALVLVGCCLFYGLMAVENHNLPCTEEKEVHKVQSLLHSVLMLGFFINLVSLLVNAGVVPYFDVSQNLVRSKQRPGQAPIFDWRSSVYPYISWLTIIMQGAHICLAIFQLSLINGHSPCFKAADSESGSSSMTADGKRLFALAIVQLLLVIVFSILKLRLSSIMELIGKR